MRTQEISVLRTDTWRVATNGRPSETSFETRTKATAAAYAKVKDLMANKKPARFVGRPGQ